MRLSDLIHRRPVPEPWAEGEKIPWNDPGFSERMLKEHLSQRHDRASRRFAVIDRHVAWIDGHLLSGSPSSILDLGCGPGLYTSRLARLGHTCVGIDFSPASVAHARVDAVREGLTCRYLEGDVRTAAYGSGYGLVMMVFGELNVFRPSDARLILRKARAALAEGGLLLLEVSRLAAVRRTGESGSCWYSSASGLFSARPHLVLAESFWDEAQRVATERYYVTDAEDGTISAYAASTQGYSEQEYVDLLLESGFDAVRFWPSLTGSDDGGEEFAAVTAS